MDDSAVLLDTNVLLEATAPARELHRAALRVLNEWPSDGARLCLSGQIVREYLVVATRQATRNGLGLTVENALTNVEAFTDRCRFLAENREASEHLRRLLRTVECGGKQIHDANLVATCLAHGVPSLVTANGKDFERFEDVIGVHPLADFAPEG